MKQWLRWFFGRTEEQKAAKLQTYPFPKDDPWEVAIFHLLGISTGALITLLNVMLLVKFHRSGESTLMFFIFLFLGTLFILGSPERRPFWEKLLFFGSWINVAISLVGILRHIFHF